MLVIIHNRNKYLSPLSPFPALPGLFVGCVPQPTQKRLPIKTSPHQCDAPGIDPMIRPHLRINCTDPSEDSCPGRITVCVLSSSRARLSKLSCHYTGTVSVVFAQTNTTATRARTMGQTYPVIHPGPGTNPSIYPPFLAPARRLFVCFIATQNQCGPI